MDTNDRESEEEYAQFLLQVKDDPSYRRGQSLQTILGRSAGSCLRVLKGIRISLLKVIALVLIMEIM